jgi:hypothetical protein
MGAVFYFCLRGGSIQTWPLGRAAGGPARGTPIWPGPGPARHAANGPVPARLLLGPCLGRGLEHACQPGTARLAFFIFFSDFFYFFLYFLFFLQIFSFFPAFF